MWQDPTGGKFNTASWSLGTLVKGRGAHFICCGNLCVYRRDFLHAYLFFFVCLSLFVYACILSLCVCVCVWERERESTWLCQGLDSLWCQDSIKRFNIAIMRGCLILTSLFSHSVFQSSRWIKLRPPVWQKLISLFSRYVTRNAYTGRYLCVQQTHQMKLQATVLILLSVQIL